MKPFGTNSKKYAEAMQWRDWQTCDLIADEHKQLVNEITELRQRLLEAEDKLTDEQIEHSVTKGKLGVAREALEFYDTQGEGWLTSKGLYNAQDDYSEYAGLFPSEDTEILQEGSDSCNVFSGKRAREALAKISQ